MSKALARKTLEKAPQPAAAPKTKNFYSAHPWQCRHFNDQSEILAYVEASGAWEAIATVNPTSGFSAENIAGFICTLINDNQNGKSLLLEAMNVLQHCLDEERLTFSSEQEADRVVTRIRERIG